MADLTRDRVGAVLRELGFNETGAAGHFYWYEYPSPSRERDRSERLVARVQFYEPRSDLDAWLFVPFRPHETFSAKHSGYVRNETEVETAASRILAERLAAISRARGVPPPQRLVDAATDLFSLHVLEDWLWEHGVDPTA